MLDDEIGPAARFVFVIGNSGSGKSTLAAQIAERTGRALVSMDDFAFVAQTSVRRPISESVDEIARAANGAPSVIEGCYADLVSALAEKGDHLVWLDLPVERCLAHANARPWEPSKWPTKAQQDEFLPKLLEFIAGYPDDTSPTGRPAHESLFNSFPGTKSAQRTVASRE